MLCSYGSSLIGMTGSDSSSARLWFAIDGDLRVADPKVVIGMNLEDAVFRLPMSPMLPMLIYAAVGDAKGTKVFAEINGLHQTRNFPLLCLAQTRSPRLQWPLFRI